MKTLQKLQKIAQQNSETSSTATVVDHTGQVKAVGLLFQKGADFVIDQKLLKVERVAKVSLRDYIIYLKA